MRKASQSDMKYRMIHIRLPGEVHKRLRIRAAEMDETIQDWVLESIQKELAQEDLERKTE